MHLSGRNIKRSLISPLFDLVKVRGQGQIFQIWRYHKNNSNVLYLRNVANWDIQTDNVPKKFIFFKFVNHIGVSI